LTEAVREMLSTPVTFRHEPIGVTTKATTDVIKQETEEEPQQKRISEEVQPIQEDRREDERQLYSEKLSTISTLEETISEEHKVPAEDRTKETEAENLSSEALTHAVREMLATPFTKYQQPADIRAEEQTEKTQEVPAEVSVEQSTFITKEQEEPTLQTDIEQDARKTVQEK
ncbi:unnamed protein product, partial [Adineta steineri]